MSFLDRLREPEYDTFSRDFDSLEEDDNMDDIDDIEDIQVDDTVDNYEKPENGLEMSPEEESEADSIINIAATPVIMKEVLTQESVDAFVESGEFDIAIEEGFCLEGTKDSFTSATSDLFTEAKFYNQNQMRLTKEARTNQLFEICVQAIARAKNDPVYFKLAKVQELRRKLKAVLRQRYKAPAMKKAKEYVMRLKRSKAPTIANVAKKIG